MLKRVSIQNFKSLKDVTLDLQKVNLLIGPNNSGKTNFLKAFNFTYQFLDGSKKVATNNHYKKNTANEIGVVFTFDEDKPVNSSDKYLTILIKEALTFKAEEIYEVRFGRSQTIDLKDIVLEDNDDPGVDLMVDYAGTTTIYRPDPNQFISPGIFSADAINLKGDCSNLIQFLFYLSTNYKRIYRNIESDLARCTGDMIGISTPPVKVGDESRLGLKFFGQNDEDFWAEEVSEGVLYFLALITIINQPNPPKLLLLEEPEKGIHPRRIWEVMKFIFQLAEEKDVQIIMTTHNEHVVNAFSSIPESVFVFDKDEETGATTVKNLQEHIIKPSHQASEKSNTKKIDFTSELGEKWMYGLIGGVPADDL